MESLFDIGFANKQQQKTISTIAVIVATLILLLVILSGLYYTVYGLHKERKKSNRSPVEMSISSKPEVQKLEKTIQQNLFGKKAKIVVQKPTKPAPIKVEVAPETKLNLALKGLLSATRQESARAIISVKKKPSKMYRVGDEIIDTNGVTIEEIKSDSVLINRNGNIENLALVKKKSKGKNSIITFGDDSVANEPFVGLPEPRREEFPRSVNRSRPNNNVTRSTASGRRAIKAPSSSQFRGLDAAIERELESQLEEELEAALYELERP